MTRVSIKAFTAALLLGGLLAGSASAQYAGELSVSTTSLAPGESLRVSGDGYAPNAQVTITMFSAPVVLGVTRADATGFFSETVTIPAGTQPGPHRIEARGEAADGGILVLAVTVTVQGSAAAGAGSSAGGTLAGTGLDLAVMAGIAAGLIATGVALWMTRRPRRPQQV